MGGLLQAIQNIIEIYLQGFPAPIEVWVVSYDYTKNLKEWESSQFPSPLEGWVVSYRTNPTKLRQRLRVSGPYRGMGGFLPDEGPHRERLDVVFPSPLDGWVVSYDRGFTTNVIE